MKFSIRQKDNLELLQATMSSREMSEEDREKNLIRWNEAPSAEFCHPRNEHLLPLTFVTVQLVELA